MDHSNTPLNIHFETLGCRTNTAETSLMAEVVVGGGHILVDDVKDADFLVLNSCTVTHGADRDVGKLIRRSLRANPALRVVVTGCLPVAYPNHTVLEGVDVCLKGNDPQALLTALGGGASSGVGSTKERRFVLERRGGMSRVHVKIAEGCDHRCSYCIVPDARGAPRSESPESIFREVGDASLAGFEEVVLTATHVLKYGKDLSPVRSLMWLMKKLEEAVPGPRFRLSSMEPGPAMEEVVGHLLESPRWCRHLHLAIQNGSDGVLARMRRPYRFETVERELERLSERDSSLGIGMDVIVGFPGETDAEFQESLERIQGLPFHYLHVFPYSPRKGTEAALMRPFVPSQIVKARSALLRNLSKQRRQEFAEGFVGKEMEVLVETVLPNRFTGITDNYLRVTGSGSNLKKGKLAKFLVCKAIDGVLWVNQPWEEVRS